jgi:hypothetical protein
MPLNRVPDVFAVADLDSSRRWYEPPLERTADPPLAPVTTVGRADHDGRLPSGRRPGRGTIAAVRRILTRGVASVVVVLAVSSSSAAAATAPSGQTVVDWNTIARQAIARGAGSNVSTAMVQVAVYDAVTAIDGRFEPFATRIRAHRRASQEAATAAAAHRLLVLLFPAQAEELDRTYADYLAGIPDGKPKSEGIAVGERAARGTFAFREGDGRDNQVPWVQPPPGPGVFEPTTPGPPAGTALAQTRPFTFDSPARFRPDGPTSLSSPRYAAEFDEVKELGRLDSVTRTAEQTAIALFWADGSISQWNRALQRITIARELSLPGAARLFALGSVAGPTRLSDAGRRSTTTRGGGRSTRSRVPTPTATPRRRRSRIGNRSCGRRRTTPNIHPGTPATRPRSRRRSPPSSAATRCPGASTARRAERRATTAASRRLSTRSSTPASGPGSTSAARTSRERSWDSASPPGCSPTTSAPSPERIHEGLSCECVELATSQGRSGCLTAAQQKLAEHARLGSGPALGSV